MDAEQKMQEAAARTETEFRAERKAFLASQEAKIKEANEKAQAWVARAIAAEVAAHGPNWEATQKQAFELLDRAEKASGKEQERLVTEALHPGRRARISDQVVSNSGVRLRGYNGELDRDASRYSSGHTEGHHLGRTRRCFGTRLAKRPGLLVKRIQLRLHEFSLNSKKLLEILGLAQFVYAFDGSGNILLSIGFHSFSYLRATPRIGRHGVLKKTEIAIHRPARFLHILLDGLFRSFTQGFKGLFVFCHGGLLTID
jgi:hypothetical protein